MITNIEIRFLETIEDIQSDYRQGLIHSSQTYDAMVIQEEKSTADIIDDFKNVIKENNKWKASKKLKFTITMCN